MALQRGEMTIAQWNDIWQKRPRDNGLFQEYLWFVVDALRLLLTCAHGGVRIGDFHFANVARFKDGSVKLIDWANGVEAPRPGHSTEQAAVVDRMEGPMDTLAKCMIAGPRRWEKKSTLKEPNGST